MNWENLLNKINEKISLVVCKGKEFLPELYQDARLSSGKRLRAKLFFVFSQDVSEKSLKLATAIELLHAATLIHDDILDNSKLRRGNSALYTRHGVSTGLLYGDYLFSSAFSIIAELCDLRIFTEATRALREVLIGEIIENHKKKEVALRKKEYLSIIEKKSGVLFGLASKLGAMIRGLDEEIIGKSYQFGVLTGMVYQIMDDYFDYFGENDDKDKFKDIKESLVTLPLIYLLEKCSDSEKNIISSILNSENPEYKDIRYIMSLMEGYDVSELVCMDIRLFIEEANILLPQDIFKNSRIDFDIFSFIRDKISHAQK